MKLSAADFLLGGLVFLSHRGGGGGGGGMAMAEQLADSAFARIMMAKELMSVDNNHYDKEIVANTMELMQVNHEVSSTIVITHCCCCICVLLTLSANNTCC